MAVLLTVATQVSSSDVKPAVKTPSPDTTSQADNVNVEVEEPVDAGAKFD